MAHKDPRLCDLCKELEFLCSCAHNCARSGIGNGAKEHVVAVPCDRDPQPVRTFPGLYADLHELAAWLKRCGTETVPRCRDSRNVHADNGDCSPTRRVRG